MSCHMAMGVTLDGFQPSENLPMAKDGSLYYIKKREEFTSFSQL